MGDILGMVGTREDTRSGHWGIPGDTGGTQRGDVEDTGGGRRDMGDVWGPGDTGGSREGEHGGGRGHGWDTSPTGNARNVPDKAQGGSSPDTPAHPPCALQGAPGGPQRGTRPLDPGRDPLGPSGPAPRGSRGENGEKGGERRQKGVGRRWGGMG